MFDMHKELKKFFKENVKLDPEEKKKLTEYRDANIKRLKKGLTKLEHKLPQRTPNQGGYAMFSLTQRPENNPDIDQDIDVAIVFKKDDLPEAPLAARQRVLDGIVEGGGNFKKDPEARTNAVTVWYVENYHVDMPVFREYTNDDGDIIIEHAGVEWTERDPRAITKWFNDDVNSKSPNKDNGATVENYQMRRMVQFLKYYSKSRSSWKLPGGLIISVLVSEKYQSNSERDDQALYDTMVAVRDRITNDKTVCNPVDPSQLLTYKAEYENQVGRLEDKLTKAIDWLAPLFTSDCTRLTALKAWNNVFKHSYWKQLIEEEEERIKEANKLGTRMKAASENGTFHVSSSGSVLFEKTDKKSTVIPNHRFYGSR